MSDELPTAVVVTSFEGDPTVEQRAAAAARGELPRKDFVELAARLPRAVVIDVHHMRERACLPARAVARIAGLPAGQVVEVFLRRRRYAHVLAWADRIGVPLALLFKLRRAKTDLVLVSVLLTRGAKAFLVRRLNVHTHMRAILVRRLQGELLANGYGVPPEKLIEDVREVDERFFSVAAPRRDRIVCAVGWEERDYATLLRAAAGLDARVELAVGSIAMASDSTDLRDRIGELLGAALPPNVVVGSKAPAELRELYAASSCVVVPVREAGFDAGVTATVEAMATGRPVVVSRTQALADLFVDEQHGLFVPPGDPDRLRASIERLLEDPEEAERMGSAARALVERRHRLDDRVDRIAAALLGSAS